MKKMSQLALVCAMFAISSAPVRAAKKSESQAAPEWMKYTVPGDGHAIFKDLVGNWKVASKWWMSASSKPEESKGTTVNRLILDGRFLQSDFKTVAMGHPFQGMGLLGYDAFRGEYQSVWVDTMSTSVMHSTGSYDPNTKVLNETGTMSDPSTGDKNRWYRGEWKFESKKTHSFSMFAKDTEGKEFKMMELTYTR